MKLSFLLRALPALLLPPATLLAQGGAFTLQGQLSPKMPPTKAYLSYSADGKTTTRDSADVTRGHFTFKGRAAAPVAAYLFVIKPGTRASDFRFVANMRFFKLYLEPGTVKLTSPDSLLHATLAGTPLNADQNRLMNATRPADERQYILMQEQLAASPAQRQNEAFMTSIEQRFEAVNADRRVRVQQFIQHYPQSLVSLAALNDLGGAAIDPATVGPLFEGLAPTVRQSPDGLAYAGRLERARRVAVGAVAPDFSQSDPAGKPVKLSDFRGKYVLVDFWASWCKPCRAENPNVVASFNQYKSRNFTVLSVSLDRAREPWLKAIDADHLTWTHVSDLKFWQNEVAQLYDIQAIPQNLLIGPDGRIVAKNLRGEELGQKLAAVLPGSGAQ